MEGLIDALGSGHQPHQHASLPCLLPKSVLPLIASRQKHSPSGAIVLLVINAPEDVSRSIVRKEGKRILITLYERDEAIVGAIVAELSYIGLR